MLSCNLLRQRNKLSRTVSTINSSIKWNIVNFNVKRTAWTAVELNRNPYELRAKWPRPSFNIEKMTALIDHDNHDMRKEMRKFLSDPSMIPKYNISLEDEREVYRVIFIYIFYFTAILKTRVNSMSFGTNISTVWSLFSKLSLFKQFFLENYY